MTSFPIKIGGIGRWRGLGERPPDAVVSFDVGTGLAKSVVVEWRNGRALVTEALRGDVADAGAWVPRGHSRGRTAVCGVNGYGVKAAVHDLPRLSSKDTAALIARAVAKESGGDSLHEWTVVSADSGGVKALVVSAPAHLVGRSVAEMQTRGVRVEGVFADVNSLCECLAKVRPESEGEVAGILLLGETWSHFVIVDHGRMVFARLIKLGVSTLVTAVASICALDEARARQIVLGGRMDVSSLPDTLEERGPAEALREAVERISGEMLRSMAFASKRMGASPPARVYVAGGGALIGGLVDALQQLSGIETVVLNPLSGIAHRCDPGTVAAGPVFCVAIGQALLARRKRPPNLMPAELRARRTRVPRLVLAFASLSVALVYVVLAAMALDSAAGIYRKAAEDHGLLRSALASGTGERAELGSLADQDAALAYSLLVGPQPRWSEIVKGVSNAIPRGVLLDNLVFSKESGEGGTVNWRVDIRGAIVDPERAHEILGQMKAGLEEPGPLKSVQMMPLGSTTIDLNGRRIDGAIVFETTGLLE